MPNTEAINPNMDMEYILASYKDDEPETNAGEGASEPEQQTTTVPEGESGHDEPTAGTEPAQQEPAKTEVQDAPAGEQQAGAAPAEEDPKKGKDGDGGVAGPDGKTNAASEPAKAGTKGPRRNPLSRLEKAEYSTKKWKRKYREMRESRDALQAELEKYSQINPAQFRDPEERERFIAWKARTEQKLNGMDEDLEDFARRQYEHEYEAKVSAFYPTEDSRNSFEALDEHYGHVLDATCEKLDPGVLVHGLPAHGDEPVDGHPIPGIGMVAFGQLPLGVIEQQSQGILFLLAQQGAEAVVDLAVDGAGGVPEDVGKIGVFAVDVAHKVLGDLRQLQDGLQPHDLGGGGVDVGEILAEKLQIFHVRLVHTRVLPY